MKRFLILALCLIAFFLCVAPASAHGTVFVAGVGFVDARDVEFTTFQMGTGQVIVVPRAVRRRHQH